MTPPRNACFIKKHRFKTTQQLRRYPFLLLVLYHVCYKQRKCSCDRITIIKNKFVSAVSYSMNFHLKKQRKTLPIPHHTGNAKTNSTTTKTVLSNSFTLSSPNQKSSTNHADIIETNISISNEHGKNITSPNATNTTMLTTAERSKETTKEANNNNNNNSMLLSRRINGKVDATKNKDHQKRNRRKVTTKSVQHFQQQLRQKPKRSSIQQTTALRRIQSEWKDVIDSGVAFDWKRGTPYLCNPKIAVRRKRNYGPQQHLNQTSSELNCNSTNPNASNISSYIWLGPLSKHYWYIWHFTFVGVPGSVYENGYYHGRIIINPKNYPYTPPKIQVLTKSGRFIPYHDICLSHTSNYHPELWIPGSVTIRSIVDALRLHMVSTSATEAGGINAPYEQRLHYAKESCNYTTEIPIISGVTSTSTTTAANNNKHHQRVIRIDHRNMIKNGWIVATTQTKQTEHQSDYNITSHDDDVSVSSALKAEDMEYLNHKIRPGTALPANRNRCIEKNTKSKNRKHKNKRPCSIVFSSTRTLQKARRQSGVPEVLKCNDSYHNNSIATSVEITKRSCRKRRKSRQQSAIEPVSITTILPGSAQSSQISQLLQGFLKALLLLVLCISLKMNLIW